MKLKNFEIVELYLALNKLREEKTSIRIQYNCLKSITVCEPIVKIIDAERERILTATSEKESDGKAKIKNGCYVYPSPEIEAAAIASIVELNSLENELALFSIPLAEAMDIKLSGAILAGLLGRFFIEKE